MVCGFPGNHYKREVGQKYIAETRLFNYHFYKSFVKISAVAWQ